MSVVMPTPPTTCATPGVLDTWNPVSTTLVVVLVALVLLVGYIAREAISRFRRPAADAPARHTSDVHIHAPRAAEAQAFQTAMARRLHHGLAGVRPTDHTNRTDHGA